MKFKELQATLVSAKIQLPIVVVFFLFIKSSSETFTMYM